MELKCRELFLSVGLKNKDEGKVWSFTKPGRRSGECKKKQLLF